MVLAGWAFVALSLRPFEDVPVIDDWVYAWSVEHLLGSGRLELLDYSANLIHAQALWGALFCLPTGFSFSALRLSTFLLSCAALAGVHRLLVEAGATRAAALVGTLTLAAYPPFLLLSFSFMTDVPFVAVEVWSLVLFARALRRRSMVPAWAGTALATLATGVRSLAVVPAIAMSVALGVAGDGWGRLRARFIGPLLPAAALGLLVLYHGAHTRDVADLTYIENSPVARMASLRTYGLAILPQMLVLSMEFVAVMSGLALAPVAVALVSRSRARLVAGVAAVAAVVVAAAHALGVEHYVPQDLPLGPGWSVNSDVLGAALTLMPGWTPLSMPAPVTWTAVAVLWGSSAVIGAAAVARGAADPARPLLWWTLAGFFVLGALLWLVSDRYILPFLPVALGLALGRGTQGSWRAAVPVLLASAIVGVVSLRDREAVQHALWSGVSDLRARGVPVSAIDAGYVVNGWLQYAHAERAHRDAQGRVAVPWMNADVDLPWIVASRPLPGTRVVAEHPFRRTFGPAGSIVVLRRLNGADRAPR